MNANLPPLLLTEGELRSLRPNSWVHVQYEHPEDTPVDGSMQVEQIDGGVRLKRDQVHLDYKFSGNDASPAEVAERDSGRIRIFGPAVECYDEHGTRIRQDRTPAGWVEVDVYHPHSTPWDSYGNKHLAEICKVLFFAGIVGRPLVTHCEKKYPMGTGPGGRVRLGDDMLPGVYRVAVAKKDETAAVAALQAHQQAIERWLHHGGEMPDACKQ